MSTDEIISQLIDARNKKLENDEYWCNKDASNPCKDCECDLRTLQGTDDCMVCEGTNNIEEYNQTVLEFPRHKDFYRGYKICYTNAICLLCKECREKAMLMTMIPSGWDDWDILDEICQSIKNSIK